MLGKVTDPVLLSELARQSIYSDEVEFCQDYGLSVKGVSSPYMKRYKHLKSSLQFAVFSGLPMVNFKGQLLDVGFESVVGGYRTKTNVFDSFVQADGRVTAGCQNDQPDGRKAGQIARWQPTLYYNKIKQSFGNYKLLDVDPINSNYIRNTTEWELDICKRRTRSIEGHFIGYWEFYGRPNKIVRIVYNQSGDFPVRLGQFAISPNEEVIAPEDFDLLAERQGGYPVRIYDSATFNPDAATSVDGYVCQNYTIGVDAVSWATIIAAAGNASGYTDLDTLAQVRSDTATNKWVQIIRPIVLFPTGTLPDTATIIGGVLSFYITNALHELTADPAWNIFAATPASDTVLANGDFDATGGATPTPYANAISYSGLTISDYIAWTLVAAGIAAISKTINSKFSMRDTHDSTGVSPTWASLLVDRVAFYCAEKGTGYKPKLVVTYSEPYIYKSYYPHILAH